MQENGKQHPESLAETRQKLGMAALSLLASHPLSALDREMVAAVAETDAALARRLFPDCASMALAGLGMLDDQLLQSLAQDVEDDSTATTREILLEGLVQRFEGYTPHKDAIRNLNTAAMQNPPLAACLVASLNRAMAGMLETAGGTAPGIIGMLRIKGLSGVALICLRDWLKDDTPDLAATQKAVDQRLGQAESLGLSLGIIRQQTAAETTTEDQKEEWQDDRNT